MRRAAACLALVAALLPAAPAAAAPPAGAELLACDRVERAAEFRGSMELGTEADGMAMRFALQVRRAGQRRFRPVSAPGFGEWTSADPGVTRYVYTRRVEALIGPARYRVAVRFRWTDADGETLARTRARSAACAQPRGVRSGSQAHLQWSAP